MWPRPTSWSSPARGLPGAGSAAPGLLMFGTSAFATPMPGLFGGSPVAMGLVMTGWALLTALVFGLGRLWVARHPESEAAFGV